MARRCNKPDKPEPFTQLHGYAVRENLSDADGVFYRAVLLRILPSRHRIRAERARVMVNPGLCVYACYPYGYCL